MITVGLVNELKFISKALRTPVSINLKSNFAKGDIYVGIKEQVLEVWYLGYHIWKESLDDATMFGIESCDNIGKAILVIDNDGCNWKKYTYFDK